MINYCIYCSSSNFVRNGHNKGGGEFSDINVANVKEDSAKGDRIER